MIKINQKAKFSNTILIIPDIRSAENVGSMFRTADAVGVSKVYITGYSPTPLDKYGRKRKDIAKTALGAEDSVPWEYKKSLSLLIKKLKKEGCKIVALEQDEKSIDYKRCNKIFSTKTVKKLALIVGNEVTGLDKKILKECDAIIEIPMRGKKESLNVAVSFSIAIFRILNV